MMKLTLVRHGITEWNLSRRLQGHSDVPLSAKGLQQAQALAACLSSELAQAIYASDLRRAQETAQAIAARQKAAVRSDARLREINFGDWEGLTYEEIRQRNPTALSHWETHREGSAPPGGEMLKQLVRRVQSSLDEMRARHVDENVLVVAHGGPLQVLLCLALGLPAQMYWQFHLSTASISRLSFWPAGAILDTLNDTCHLDEEIYPRKNPG